METVVTERRNYWQNDEVKLPARVCVCVCMWEDSSGVQLWAAFDLRGLSLLYILCMTNTNELYANYSLCVKPLFLWELYELPFLWIILFGCVGLSIYNRYSALRMYSYPLILFTFCYFAALLTALKTNIYISQHSIHHIDKAKTELSQLCKLITNKNIYVYCISIHTLN